MKAHHAAVLALCLASGLCNADPMRPLAASMPASAGASSPLAAAVPRAAGPAVPTIGRLIAIRQDSSGKRQALIGERWVAVGDKLESAPRTLVSAIDANSVTLHADNGKKRAATPTQLHLLPPLQASMPDLRDLSAPTAIAQASASGRHPHRAAALKSP